MKPFTALNIAVGVVAAISFASLAPPAYANDADNPYLPKPAASTETADHGAGTYCRIGLTIPAWTCDQELSANGNAGITDSGHSTVTPPKPTTTPPGPPSPPGPTTGGDL